MDINTKKAKRTIYNQRYEKKRVLKMKNDEVHAKAQKERKNKNQRDRRKRLQAVLKEQEDLTKTIRQTIPVVQRYTLPILKNCELFLRIVSLQVNVIFIVVTVVNASNFMVVVIASLMVGGIIVDKRQSYAFGVDAALQHGHGIADEQSLGVMMETVNPHRIESSNYCSIPVDHNRGQLSEPVRDTVDDNRGRLSKTADIEMSPNDFNEARDTQPAHDNDQLDTDSSVFCSDTVDDNRGQLDKTEHIEMFQSDFNLPRDEQPALDNDQLDPKFLFLSFEEAISQVRHPTSFDNGVFSAKTTTVTMCCKNCASPRGFPQLDVFDSCYNLHCIHTNRWWDTHFVVSFGVLMAHHYHNPTVKLILCNFPKETLPHNNTFDLEKEITTVVAIANASGHFAVLEYIISDKTFMVYDGKGYPVTTWKNHYRNIRAQCRLDGRYKAKSVALVKQADAYNCGPIACLHVWHLLSGGKFNPLSFLSENYRAIILSEYHSLLETHSQYILKKCKVSKV